jgi:hypothetical protein
LLLRNLVLAFLLLFSVPALASSDLCPDGSDRAHFTAFRDRIAAAATPEAAREMALEQTRLGHMAISEAARLAPRNKGIGEAEARLSSFDEGVKAARTQQEVAAQFDYLAVSHPVGVSCDYSGAEVVVIVIGFILGILPGILFLFLFC